MQFSKPSVYILQSLKNLRYYVGSTNNLERRMAEHIKGKTKSTRNLLPVKLVFYKNCRTLGEARSLEYKIKKLKSRKIIEQIIKDKNIKLK